MEKMVRLILNNQIFLSLLGVLVLIAGWFSYQRLAVDAFPDVTPVLVQVFTETEGIAPDEVEKFVTYPVEAAMNGLPNLEEIRSSSNFGLSVVNLYFKEGTDIYFARQLVSERLQEARKSIPEGFGEPQMGPIATGLGQILFYVVEDETKSRSPEELREIQDQLIKFNLTMVPGVTEVLSLGGEVRQFQVQVRPEDLLRYDLTIGEVRDKIKANNRNVGAQFLVKNGEEYVIRSVGLAENIRDLKSIILKVQNGTPVTLEQVADVQTGGELRRGLATMNGTGEVVVGMILKLIGTNTSTVIADVKTRLEEINKMLPKGVKVVPYYDQSTLVKKCVQTVTEALLLGVLLVSSVLLLFMGSLRASLVVALSIPFSIFFAFILMKMMGISSNLMSLGGLAIAIGMMVDATIVMVENVDRLLRMSTSKQSRTQVVARACGEVARPVLVAVAIIILVFLPLFTLQGVEGKTFRPLAQTVALGLLGSMLYALLLAPVAAYQLMRAPRGSTEPEALKSGEVGIVRWLLRLYRPAVGLFVRHRWMAVVLSVVMLLSGTLVFARLGSEFVPRLDEGDLLIRATMAPSISLEEARETMLRFERRLMSRFPEVTRVVTRVGRGEIGAHADPVNSAESLIQLKPQSQWTSARMPDELKEKISAELSSFPGVQFNVTQPIAAAVDELITGTKAEFAIKIFGAEREILKKLADQVGAVIREIPGATDVAVDQVAGTPQVLIRIDRQSIARYGLNVEDVQDVIRAAVGGDQAGQIFEGIRRFDINVRFVGRARGDVEAIGRILITGPGGLRVPLNQLATIEEVTGPRQISRENGQRFISVQCNVRGRDIGGFVADAQKMIAKRVPLPTGYRLDWGGQFELQQQANRRLAWVVPITLLAVFLLLFLYFRSLKGTLLILFNIPLAMVGGVVALGLTGQHLSVPGSVGFIALFGIALENGMVLVTYMNQLLQSGMTVDEASLTGATLRLRPVLMTALTTALGLLPLLLSSGVGSEVQRPLATVVIGGLVTSTALTLLVLPALYKWFPGTSRS